MMIESKPPEKCYYCEKEATHNDMGEETVISVCIRHLNNGLSA